MAAAPKNMTFTWRGDITGNIVQYDAYNSDVTTQFLKWSKGGTAGSGQTDNIFLDENSTLVDVSVPSGLTDTTKVRLVSNDALIPGKIINVAQVVNTLPSRSFPIIKMTGGRKLQFDILT